MEFQIFFVHIQIFVQGLLLMKILLMEFSFRNIFQFSKSKSHPEKQAFQMFL